MKKTLEELDLKDGELYYVLMECDLVNKKNIHHGYVKSKELANRWREVNEANGHIVTWIERKYFDPNVHPDLLINN